LAAAGFYLLKRRRDFPPSVWGKASTFAQILFICFRIGELDGIAVHAAVIGLEWAVAALVAISTVDYARRVLAAGN
jgi:phosphatidylglycerophosphate synthase